MCCSLILILGSRSGLPGKDEPGDGRPGTARLTRLRITKCVVKMEALAFSLSAKLRPHFIYSDES